MAIVKALNIGHSYDGKLYVLNDISFELNAGQTLVITGPSGSGKSTIMNLLAMLMKPTKGALSFQNVDIATLNETQRTKMRLANIGMVRQDLALLPDRSALENVTVPLLLMGKIDKKEIVQRGQSILERVGLEAQIHSKSGQMSGGERQRLAIARALISNPKLILADEPTAQLDEANAHRIKELLIHMTEKNAALVFATHDMSLVDSFDQRLQLR